MGHGVFHAPLTQQADDQLGVNLAAGRAKACCEDQPDPDPSFLPPVSSLDGRSST